MRPARQDSVHGFSGQSPLSPWTDCNNNNNIIIIIITLFQEDNIFGTNASLTYGPQIQIHACV